MNTDTLLSFRAYNARVGFWSSITFAILITVLNIAFTMMVIQAPTSGWRGMEEFASTYRVIDFIPQMIGLVTIPAFLLMLICIHLYTDDRFLDWSLASVMFGTAFAGLLGTLYFIQVAVIYPALNSGNYQGLEQFAFANPRSVAWGLNHFAWSLLGVSLFFMAWVFGDSRLERWIRRLFLLNGLANIMLIFAFTFDIKTLTLVIAFVSWVIALPVAAVLVGLLFRTQTTT